MKYLYIFHRHISKYYKRREQGRGSREQGAGGRGQGAGSREQGAGSREQIRNTHLHQFRASVKKKMFLQDA